MGNRFQQKLPFLFFKCRPNSRQVWGAVISESRGLVCLCVFCFVFFLHFKCLSSCPFQPHSSDHTCTHVILEGNSLVYQKLCLS